MFSSSSSTTISIRRSGSRGRDAGSSGISIDYRSPTRFVQRKSLHLIACCAKSAVRGTTCDQSKPENSKLSCAALSVTAPSCTGGHVKRPLSSRLVKSTRPEPSQTRTFSLSACFGLKTNTSPANGSVCSVSFTNAARASMPRRKSTGRAVTTIRNPGRTGRSRIVPGVRDAWEPAAGPLRRPRH